MSPEHILEMRQISKAFPGVQALSTVDFYLKPGEIHALIGENGAGKSTLMKILTGNYHLDSGEIIYRGQPVSFANPHQAIEAGISIIHQELNLVPEMNATQNIFLGQGVGARLAGVIDRGTRQELAAQALAGLNVTIDLHTPVRQLSVAHQQMIEIAKALSTKADILVMDEPTSSLTDREIETLYEVIFSLKKRGVTIVYISHRLEEIFHLTDRLTVLRDGHHIATKNTQDVSMNELVRLMVGRDLQRFFQHRTRPGAGLWSQAAAEQVTLNLLDLYPNLKGVYAANDTMARGVVEALKQAGRVNEVVTVGTDGSPEALAAVKNGSLDATVAVFSYDYGRVALELALRTLAGQRLPARITWPAALVTASSPDQAELAAEMVGRLEAELFQEAVPVPDRPYTIGVVLKTLSNQHWQVMKRGYEETAQKYNVRVKVVAADSEGEEAQQLALTEALLAEGCDALCVSPLTGTNLTPAVEQAMAAGLPVINVDDARVEGTAVTTLLSAGQVAIGQQVADYFINNLRPGDRVAMIGGKPGSQAAELRRRGFYRGLKKSKLVFTHNRKIALEVKNLSTKDLLKNVNFTAHWGEIFGIAGLIGAGRTELVRAIFGADPIQSGEILVDGQSVTIKSPRDAIKLGLGLVPEDRKNQGLILGMSVLNNATLTILDRIAGWGIIQTARRRGIADEYVAKLSVKTPSLGQQVRFLSGGNQQKVVIAKWLASQARILIFDEPTRGIDVGAKVEIRELVNELVKQGVCVIVISSELPEVLGMCDRVMVMHEGRVTGVFEAVWTSEEEILHYASGLTTEFVPNQ